MYKHIFIIDDEKIQADGLAKQLNTRLSDKGYIFEPLSGEDEILQAVNDRFCSLAIVDLKMPNYNFDGLTICRSILKNNPLAKVIIVSAWLPEFLTAMHDLLTSGNVLAVSEKKAVSAWVPELEKTITDYFDKKDKELSENSKMLLNAYSAAKNETNSFRKGVLFEDFLVNLFGQIGFQFIRKRVTDATSEVDLILRNDIDDAFLAKFGKYIFVEAKNRPSTPVDKNDFLAFVSKIESSSGLAELGIIAASHKIASTVRLEALRSSQKSVKVLLFTNDELTRLIMADDKRYELKKLIDEQIKDVPS